MNERDPHGLAPSAPGAKLDAEKVMAELTIDGFSRALLAVAKVSTYGAKKYSPGGWQHVQDGQVRYRRAGDRHRLARGHEELDPDTGLLHLAHECWNRLAELELLLRERENLEIVLRAKGSTAPHLSPAGRQPGAPDAAPEQADAEKSVLREKPAGVPRWHIWSLVEPKNPDLQYICHAKNEEDAFEQCRRDTGFTTNSLEWGICRVS